MIPASALIQHEGGWFIPVAHCGIHGIVVLIDKLPTVELEGKVFICADVVIDWHRTEYVCSGGKHGNFEVVDRLNDLLETLAT